MTTRRPQVRRPADYILIPGEVTGGSSEVVYMVDITNGWLGAMAYDDSAHVLNTMPPIDFARVRNRTCTRRAAPLIARSRDRRPIKPTQHKPRSP